MAMTIQWLLAWYNLIFILPLFLALLYVGIYAVSGLTFGETDVDASGGEIDADAHVELDGHVDGPAHGEMDHDVSADADADVDADAQMEGDAHSGGDGHDSQVAPGSVLANAMSLLGVGKV